MQSEPVALDEVIGAAVLAVPGRPERVSVDVPEDLPLVQADPGLLERVLANLLDNAVRHGRGGGRVEVSAIAGDDEREAQGRRPWPGRARRAARAAVRAVSAARRTRRLDGVGLGLTVARGFIEAMDGVLIADGSSGGGLTMRLRLPLAR